MFSGSGFQALRGNEAGSHLVDFCRTHTYIFFLLKSNRRLLETSGIDSLIYKSGHESTGCGRLTHNARQLGVLTSAVAGQFPWVSH